MKIIQKEGMYSHEREMPEEKGVGGFKRMPVIDVRDGKNHRQRVEEILKAERINRGSKFMKPSFSVIGYSYNVSPKK